MQPAPSLINRRISYIDGDGFIRRGDVVGLARNDEDKLTLLRLASPEDEPTHETWTEEFAVVARGMLLNVNL